MTTVKCSCMNGRVRHLEFRKDGDLHQEPQKNFPSISPTPWIHQMSSVLTPTLRPLAHLTLHFTCLQFSFCQRNSGHVQSPWNQKLLTAQGVPYAQPCLRSLLTAFFPFQLKHPISKEVRPNFDSSRVKSECSLGCFLLTSHSFQDPALYSTPSLHSHHISLSHMDLDIYKRLKTLLPLLHF